MILNSFSRSGALHNEDTFSINPNFGFVLDGATGLLKERITQVESDAQWFVVEWKKFLENNLNSETPLKEILKQGVKAVNDLYMSLPGAENVKSKPSSGMALYRVNNGKLEYLLLGDCSIAITKKSGEVVLLQPQQLTMLDQINIDRMSSIAKEKGINVIDARELITEHLLETRLTQNTDKGYYILSDSYEAIDNALYGEMDFDEVKQIAAFSDGYSQIFDTFSLLTVEKLAEVLGAGASLGELYNILWYLQEKDKHCNKYPRFKVRDDATAILYKV